MPWSWWPFADAAARFAATLVQIVNLVTNRVSRVVGMMENTERFVCVALFQARSPWADPPLVTCPSCRSISGACRVVQGAAKKAKLKVMGGEARGAVRDPTLVAAAYKKHRVYLFSRREPEETEAGTGRWAIAHLPYVHGRRWRGRPSASCGVCHSGACHVGLAGAGVALPITAK